MDPHPWRRGRCATDSVGKSKHRWTRIVEYLPLDCWLLRRMPTAKRAAGRRPSRPEFGHTRKSFPLSRLWSAYQSSFLWHSVSSIAVGGPGLDGPIGWFSRIRGVLGLWQPCYRSRHAGESCGWRCSALIRPEQDRVVSKRTAESLHPGLHLFRMSSEDRYQSLPYS
jgi:hypothetical protein